MGPFPTGCRVSLACSVADGHTAATGLVGREGVVGLPLFLGGEDMLARAEVQVAGGAVRLPARALRAEVDRGGPFHAALLRYTLARIGLVSRTAVCNRLHTVEQRLCRWLLMTCDRLASGDVPMTHESLGHLLGVRREGVTTAAAQLQEAGLVRCVRGHIRVLDLPGLEAASCECYRAVSTTFARLRVH